jgi:hypothetical protein
MSIRTFCHTHEISESFYHKLQRAGLGPQVMRIGARSAEAARKWRLAREAATVAAE